MITFAQRCMSSPAYLWESCLPVGILLLCFTTLKLLCIHTLSHSVTISAVGLEVMDTVRGIGIGETTSFVCEATTTVCSLDLNITWFRSENGSDVQLFQNGDNINITMETLNTTRRSTLTIRVTGIEDYTQYYCLANNGNSTERSNFTVALVPTIGEALLLYIYIYILLYIVPL